MASKREPSPSLRMRKIALVICEGETEVCYINLLKSWYKSPIRIISHIEGTKITPSLVEKRTKELKISQWDKVHTFLMYDMDVQAINEKLRKCKAEMLLSNPCFEIWLLLHAKDQKNGHQERRFPVFLSAESVLPQNDLEGYAERSRHQSGRRDRH